MSRLRKEDTSEAAGGIVTSYPVLLVLKFPQQEKGGLAYKQEDRAGGPSVLPTTTEIGQENTETQEAPGWLSH